MCFEYIHCRPFLDIYTEAFLPFQVHPNATRSPHLKTKFYEFAGKIVGKCLYESALGGNYRQLVKARFTRSFLAQIIGLRVNYKVIIISLLQIEFLYVNYVVPRQP